MGQGLSKRVFLRRRSSAVLRSFDLNARPGASGGLFIHRAGFASNNVVVGDSVIMRAGGQQDGVAGRISPPASDKSKVSGVPAARQGLGSLFQRGREFR